MILQGSRLTSRPLTEADAPEFAALNGDAAVMRHFPKPLSFADSKHFRARIARHFSERGYGFWAVSRRDEPGLVGMVGLRGVPFAARFAPAVGIGWRIGSAHQHQAMRRRPRAAASRRGSGR